MHILDLTIKEIHLALVEKRITPLELAKEAIKRAKENLDNAFETIDEEGALAFASTLVDVEVDNSNIPTTVRGIDRIVEAKITGITLALFNLTGISESLLIDWRFEYCTGILRVAPSKNTTPKIIAKYNNTIPAKQATFPAVTPAEIYFVHNVTNIVGTEEIIPAEMIIEEPFPIPWRVIKSANHIVNAEPAEITTAI